MVSKNTPKKLGKRRLLNQSFSLSHGSLVVFKKLLQWNSIPVKVSKVEYSREESRMIVNFENNDSYMKKLNWCIRAIHLSTLLFSTWFSVFRLVWLKHHWHAHERIQQMFLYMILFCMGTGDLASYFTLNQYCSEMIFILTQRIKLVPIERRDVVTVGDLVMYQFLLGCSAFSTLLFFLPFSLDYDMGSLIFYHLVGIRISSLSLLYRLFIQTILGATYFIIELYGVFYFLVILMGAIAFVEGIPFLTSELIVNKSRELATVEFRKILKTYRIIQILLSQANEAIQRFVLILVIVGVLLGGWCAFGTITLYAELPILTYLSCPVIVFICFFVDFVLIYFASIPSRDAKVFKSVWVLVLKRKEDRKSLRSCCPIGFNIGPIKRINFSMALSIADCIVNCTVNLVLVKLHTT